MQQPNEALASLVARQQEMEDHALSLGGQRFRKRLEKAIAGGNEAQVGAARKLLVEGLAKVEVALEQLLVTGKRGRPHAAGKWVRKLGSGCAAYLALKVVLDNIHGRVSVRRAALDLSELVVDELRFRRFKEVEPKLFEYAMSDFSTTSYAHKARSLDARIHKAEVDISDLQLSTNERLLLGVKLLDIVREVTGLFQVETHKTKEHGRVKVIVEMVATPETLSWLEQRNNALEFIWPVNLPMVMPPLPWAPGRKGGYRFGLRGKHQLVRSASQDHRVWVEQAEMPQVFSALNRIQETPWRINLKVLETIEQLMQKGGGLAGIPLMNAEEIPEKPEDFATNPEAKKKWKRETTKTHDRNAEARIRRSELFRLLNIVNKVKQENAIWFPHNLDFRGRCYPVVNYLHPQGADMCKALLTFAEGKPIGRDGVAYLALHGASSLGKTLQGAKLSHMTLQERVDYIVSISAAIRDVAEDPVGNSWWMDADDRWQFLAFCFEWAGWLAYEAEGRGDQYVSCLPCAQDGTCNGLQHFAALWLDPVGGAAVNVVPQDRPRDIYQAIADVVLARLEKEHTTEPSALLWLTSGLVDRKLTKRPTMTFGYGSQQYGFSTQLKDYVESHEEYRSRLRDHFTATVNTEDGEETQKSLLHGACMYMAKLIWEALEQVAVSAFAGMQWMRNSAQVIAKNARQCVYWMVPGTGFPVRQVYCEQKQSQNINTVLAGKIFRPRLYEDIKGKPDWKKQASAVAPNIVHSLDASCLMLTVNSAADSGIQHFAMVHDSYGALAADGPLLATATRTAFFRLYSNTDVVNDLWTQFANQLPPGVDGMVIPVPPEKGNGGQLMDLSGVMLSDYFFS